MCVCVEEMSDLGWWTIDSAVLIVVMRIIFMVWMNGMNFGGGDVDRGDFYVPEHDVMKRLGGNFELVF